MTTFTFSGSRQTLSGGVVTAVSGASLRFVAPDATGGLVYNAISDTTAKPLIVSIPGGGFYHFEIDGVEFSSLNPEITFGKVIWGAAQVSYVINFLVGDARYSFSIGGDALDVFATVAQYQAYLDSIVCSCGVTSPAYAAGQAIDLSVAGGVVVTQDDVVVGSALADTLHGGGGRDTLIGGDGNDVLIGGDTSADLRDVVYAGGGNDSVDGGYGNDLLYGDAGNDTMAGGFGADTVIGGVGNDVITGSAYGDVVFGGDGDDFLNGGFGHDRANGGAGADRFYHLGILDHGSDWIQDYTAAEGDVLVFGNASATAADFQINLAHTANAAGERSGDDAVQEAFVIYRPTGQIMWALVDGAGQGEINIRIGGVETDLLA